MQFRGMTLSETKVTACSDGKMAEGGVEPVSAKTVCISQLSGLMLCV